jgi:hypothetical protein
MDLIQGGAGRILGKKAHPRQRIEISLRRKGLRKVWQKFSRERGSGRSLPLWAVFYPARKRPIFSKFPYPVFFH